MNMHNIEKTLNEKTYLNSFIIIFSKYYNFFDVFFRVKIDKFFFYRFNDYKILLMFNKKSSFDFIYEKF